MEKHSAFVSLVYVNWLLLSHGTQIHARAMNGLVESKCQMNENRTPKSDDFCINCSVDTYIVITTVHIIRSWFEPFVSGGGIRFYFSFFFFLGECTFWVRSKHNKHSGRIFIIYITIVHQNGTTKQSALCIFIWIWISRTKVLLLISCVFIRTISLSLFRWCSVGVCVCVFVCFVARVLNWRKRIVALDSIRASITEA